MVKNKALSTYIDSDLHDVYLKWKADRKWTLNRPSPFISSQVIRLGMKAFDELYKKEISK
jgi:hypothetical protein